MTDPVDRRAVRPLGMPDIPEARARNERIPPGRREAARLPRNSQLAGGVTSGAPATPYIERATCSSFRMDGLPLTPDEFRAAMAQGAAARACRTRSARRARNHVAILRRIELLLRRGQPLRDVDVIRWYTSIAGGLSAGGIGTATLGRIERIVSAVNSPRLRFRPAVQEIAALHVNLLADPFAPGFNGILARLLLRYHLGRCGLPPVVFDPATDPTKLTAVSTLEPLLFELIAQA